MADVIIHEISHSWFGNLVTNANWGEFWLNEGFTMYAQRRISATLYGKGPWATPSSACVPGGPQIKWACREGVPEAVVILWADLGGGSG